MILHNYFRSSASFRVRIALYLKGLDFDYHAVHLVKGEQQSPAYAAIAADGLVPALSLDVVSGEGDNTQNTQKDTHEVLSQSMAIIEYLDETYPAVPLLPKNALDKAKVRALAQSIACEIHPLNNLRVLKYLVKELKTDEATKTAWYVHWCSVGLASFERQLARDAAHRVLHGQPASRYCFGSTPTLADCCLVPQIFNAQRFNVPLGDFPLTMSAFDACMKLPAFQQAQPSNCPDAES